MATLATASIIGELRELLFGSPDPWLAENKGQYDGETCFLLGGGRSLRNVNLSLLRGRHVAGVNSVLYAKELKLSFYFSVSAYFWRNHADEIRNVSCHRRFLPENLKQQLSSDVPTSWLRCVYQRHLPEHAQHDFPHAFSERPEQLVHLGGTVLFPALQILAHLGFARIVLLGVDHNYGRGRGTRKKSLKGKELEGMNFVGHQWLPEDKVHVDLHQMERGYGLARHWFEHNGRQIVNATEGTKLKTFDRVRLGSELKT